MILGTICFDFGLDFDFGPNIQSAKGCGRRGKVMRPTQGISFGRLGEKGQCRCVARFTHEAGCSLGSFLGKFLEAAKYTRLVWTSKRLVDCFL